MSALQVTYLLLMAGLGLLFLFDCIRYAKAINPYVKYGAVLGCALILLDSCILCLAPRVLRAMPIPMLVLADIVAFVKIVLFAGMGMYCCSLLNYPSLPLLERAIGKSATPHPAPGRSYALAVVAVAVGGTLFSAALFEASSPRPSEFVRRLSEIQMARCGAAGKPSLVVGLCVLEFAFAEEIVFRLGIQNYIARHLRLHGNRYWIAIVLTSGLWSLGHANILDPDWVKLVQIFPLGLALGALFRKYGAESCILAHGLFNLAMMCLSPYVIVA